MHCRPENHRRKDLVVALFFAGSLAAGLFSVAGEAAAAGGDKIYQHAWACSTLYSRAPIKVLNGDDLGTAICLGEGKKGRTPMSRGDAWDLCREQFDTTSQFVNWTSKGWNCRYYPR
jgi:hypothetical protein